MIQFKDNPMLDIDMPGADTKDIQIHLYNFCQTCINGDPTDAGFQLMRNLQALANREEKTRSRKVKTSVVSLVTRKST